MHPTLDDAGGGVEDMPGSSVDYDADDLELGLTDMRDEGPPPLERTNSAALALDRLSAEQAPSSASLGYAMRGAQASPTGEAAGPSCGEASAGESAAEESARYGENASVDGDASADGGFFSSDGFECLPEGAAAHQRPQRPRRHFRKTLRPAAAQLAALGLRPGPNTIVFSVHSSLQGRQVVSSTVWLLERNTRLVVSDVDGTITKSDVLGQLMPRVGYDWSHLGVTSLYSQVTAHGYQMVYLTARGIGMAGTTREYLASIQQGEHMLPAGPCFLSPSRLIECFTREVIRRKPEEFKIACLLDIRSLWPPEHNPFYAGFGNRESDEVAYIAAGVPPARILIINPKGEIRQNKRTYCWASYPRLLQIAREMFPPVDAEEEPVEEDYTAFNYWRRPILELAPPTPDASAAEPMATVSTASADPTSAVVVDQPITDSPSLTETADSEDLVALESSVLLDERVLPESVY